MPQLIILCGIWAKQQSIVGAAAQVDSTFWLHLKSNFKKVVDFIHLSCFANYIPVVSYHTVRTSSLCRSDLYLDFFLLPWESNKMK